MGFYIRKSLVKYYPVRRSKQTWIGRAFTKAQRVLAYIAIVLIVVGLLALFLCWFFAAPCV